MSRLPLPRDLLLSGEKAFASAAMPDASLRSVPVSLSKPSGATPRYRVELEAARVAHAGPRDLELLVGAVHDGEQRLRALAADVVAAHHEVAHRRLLVLAQRDRDLVRALVAEAAAEQVEPHEALVLLERVRARARRPRRRACCPRARAKRSEPFALSVRRRARADVGDEVAAEVELAERARRAHGVGEVRGARVGDGVVRQEEPAQRVVPLGAAAMRRASSSPR